MLWNVKGVRSEDTEVIEYLETFDFIELMGWWSVKQNETKHATRMDETVPVRREKTIRAER